ncbi:MAG TPA: squalene synthase HpnC [Burkholderiaceae bacterium]
MSVDHYENFPVASILCPPALRPAIAAIYWFARTADDLADEGDSSPEARLQDLADYRADLLAVVAGGAPSPRWAPVFHAIGDSIRQYKLPTELLTDLLSAFEQDVVKQRYADRAELLDYCRRSANPVGRLLLHLYGIADATSLCRSDAICTALQLANFWQDLSVDTSRGRLYVPDADAARHGIAPEELLGRQDTPAARRVIAELVAWAAELMHAGAPLALTVPGRAGWELRLVVQGGLRILEKIERSGHASLAQRPSVRAFDAPLLLWRSLWMRAAHLQDKAIA